MIIPHGVVGSGTSVPHAVSSTAVEAAVTPAVRRRINLRLVEYTMGQLLRYGGSTGDVGDKTWSTAAGGGGRRQQQRCQRASSSGKSGAVFGRAIPGSVGRESEGSGSVMMWLVMDGSPRRTARYTRA